MSIGSRLKNLRLKRKLTQKDLGERVGRSRSTIAMYEAGTSTPSFETVCKLVAALGASIETFSKPVRGR